MTPAMNASSAIASLCLRGFTDFNLSCRYQVGMASHFSYKIVLLSFHLPSQASPVGGTLRHLHHQGRLDPPHPPLIGKFVLCNIFPYVLTEHCAEPGYSEVTAQMWRLVVTARQNGRHSVLPATPSRDPQGSRRKTGSARAYTVIWLLRQWRYI